jgi:uracil-DNA glycosylase
MAKAKTTGNEIADRILSIKSSYLDGIDIPSLPTDPQEFLDWWWTTHAKACEECPLAITRNHVVKPDGKASAQIMIIGEGPGFLEDLTALPMVGPMELQASHCNLCSKVLDCFEHRLKFKKFEKSKPAKAVTCTPNYVAKHQLKSSFQIRSTGAIVDGILLKKWKFNYPRNCWIERYNLLHPDEPWTHLSPWFVTNIVMCRTTDLTGLRDSPPESVPKQKCKKWLTYQWAAVNPKLIICFGRDALGVLVGSETKAATITPNEIVDTKFGPVLFQNHPAFFMREKGANVRAYAYAKIASTFEKALDYVGLPF